MIHKNDKLEQLCEFIGLGEIDIFNSDHHDLIHQKSIEQILNQGGELTAIPPFEKHPYLENIDCKNISGLMIGTFPPISYLCDQLNFPNLTFNGNIFPPDIPYFHGNYSSLWKYCPINFDLIKLSHRTEQPKLIEHALLESGIAYTDIISFCQRNLRLKKGISSYTAEDKLLNNIVLNDSVLPVIFNCHNINRLYFTNASFFGSDNRNNYLFDRNGNYILNDRDAFRLFLKAANDSGYFVEIAKNEEPEQWYNINEGFRSKNERNSLNQLMTTKILLKLRLSKNKKSKIFQLYSAVSPAAVNRGMVRQNKCVISFREALNIRESDAPRELLIQVLSLFFENSIDGLIDYNANA